MISGAARNCFVTACLQHEHIHACRLLGRGTRVVLRAVYVGEMLWEGEVSVRILWLLVAYCVLICLQFRCISHVAKPILIHSSRHQKAVTANWSKKERERQRQQLAFLLMGESFQQIAKLWANKTHSIEKASNIRLLMPNHPGMQTRAALMLMRHVHFYTCIFFSVMVEHLNLYKVVMHIYICLSADHRFSRFAAQLPQPHYTAALRKDTHPTEYILFTVIMSSVIPLIIVSSTERLSWQCVD